jgi:hypothetical protein
VLLDIERSLANRSGETSIDQIRQKIETLTRFKSEIPESFLDSLIELVDEERSLTKTQNRLIHITASGIGAAESKNRQVIDDFRNRIVTLTANIDSRIKELTVISKEIELTRQISDNRSIFDRYKQEKDRLLWDIEKAIASRSDEASPDQITHKIQQFSRFKSQIADSFMHPLVELSDKECSL